MREASPEFVKAVAERLCAAYRSSYVAKSFSEVLADLRNGGWDTGEREAWTGIAELIVARRDEVDSRGISINTRWCSETFLRRTMWKKRRRNDWNISIEAKQRSFGNLKAQHASVGEQECTNADLLSW